MTMELGTARITRQPLIDSEGETFVCWIVNWRNLGSCLQPTPRGFKTAVDAEQFCFERGLRIVD